MKKLVLAALLATFAAGASAADKISFGVSATYPPFESLDASNKIVGFDIRPGNGAVQTNAGRMYFHQSRFRQPDPRAEIQEI